MRRDKNERVFPELLIAYTPKQAFSRENGMPLSFYRFFWLELLKRNKKVGERSSDTEHFFFLS